MLDNPPEMWYTVDTVKRARYSTMREQLMDRMIRIYGFEHEIVIAFCAMCETYPNTEAYEKMLRALVEWHEEFPVLDEED